MDGVLDRKFLKKGTVERSPNQPDLVDMLRSALAVLSRHDEGFVLMVESGLIAGDRDDVPIIAFPRIGLGWEPGVP